MQFIDVALLHDVVTLLHTEAANLILYYEGVFFLYHN